MYVYDIHRCIAIDLCTLWWNFMTKLISIRTIIVKNKQTDLQLCKTCLFQPSDYVVALHPKYIFSYAPAVVLHVFPIGAEVKFYDGEVSKVPRTDIYKMRLNYDETVVKIEECAKQLVDCDAVVLDRKYGHYIRSTYAITLHVCYTVKPRQQDTVWSEENWSYTRVVSFSS